MDKAAGRGYYPTVNCEESKREIDSFLSGDITDERQSAFLSHAATCPECRKALRERRTRPECPDANGLEGRAGTEAGAKPRALASMNPALFAGILLLLLAGVVVAMKLGPAGYGPAGEKAQKFAPDTVNKPPKTGPAVESMRPITPEGYREEESRKAALIDPAAAMREGNTCFEKKDYDCALARFKQAAAGCGKGEMKEEARYRIISSCSALGRCAEAILQTAALERESPRSKWIGEAFLRNAECHAAKGDLDYAGVVYRNTAARFPELREKTEAGLNALGNSLQIQRDP